MYVLGLTTQKLGRVVRTNECLRSHVVSGEIFSSPLMVGAQKFLRTCCTPTLVGGLLTPLEPKNPSLY